jgi:hypothetical protein
MYEEPYRYPGSQATARPPLEPGVYEPTYVRPGEYAPLESASANYGGPVWPPYHNGAFAPRRQPGATPSVETSYPATGAPSTTRAIPSGGTTIQTGDTPAISEQSRVMFGADSVGDILGAMHGGPVSAPPIPLSALGPTSPELGYLLSQGDPRVTSTSSKGRDGEYPVPVLKSDTNPPEMEDQLHGLYGQSQQVLIPGSDREMGNRFVPMPGQDRKMTHPTLRAFMMRGKR